MKKSVFLRPQNKREKVPVAQLVEQLTLNQWVQGSNPCGDTENEALAKKFAGAFFVSKKSQKIVENLFLRYCI